MQDSYRREQEDDTSAEGQRKRPVMGPPVAHQRKAPPSPEDQTYKLKAAFLMPQLAPWLSKHNEYQFRFEDKEVIDGLVHEAQITALFMLSTTGLAIFQMRNKWPRSRLVAGMFGAYVVTSATTTMVTQYRAEGKLSVLRTPLGDAVRSNNTPSSQSPEDGLLVEDEPSIRDARYRSRSSPTFADRENDLDAYSQQGYGTGDSRAAPSWQDLDNVTEKEEELLVGQPVMRVQRPSLPPHRGIDSRGREESEYNNNNNSSNREEEERKRQERRAERRRRLAERRKRAEEEEALRKEEKKGRNHLPLHHHETRSERNHHDSIRRARRLREEAEELEEEEVGNNRGRRRN